ncbi:MAG: hypothetical protein V1725_04740 [archaeon]
MKQQIIIANLIDWSKSFVDENGSFYCGTTDANKENAARIARMADVVIYSTDVHPDNAPEFEINGGLYPVHNTILPERFDNDFVYVRDEHGNEYTLDERTTSPCLTNILQDALKGRKTALYVPRGVYFQGNAKEPFCNPHDIEKTFNAPLVTEEQLVQEDFSYIIAPKQYFDATRLDSDLALPHGTWQGVPSKNGNVFSLLRQKYPEEAYDLVFVNTGVVEGICRLHTSTGLKQMFPNRSERVINIADATTSLYGVGLGYETQEQSREACMSVCKDIGIDYMTTDEFLQAFAKEGKTC